MAISLTTVIALLVSVVILGLTVDARTQCATQGGTYRCVKTGTQAANNININVNNNVNVNQVVFQWHLFAYPCASGPSQGRQVNNGQGTATKTRPYQVRVPATDGRTCYYCNITNCRPGSCARNLQVRSQ